MPTARTYTLTFAGVPTTVKAVRATIADLRLWKRRGTVDLAAADAAGCGMQALHWRREYPRRLHVAINRKAGVPDQPKGRKFTPEYQTDLRRDRHDVAAMTRRVRVYQLRTPELARRFADWLSRYDD